MVNRFTVNDVTYTAKPFDFDTVCELEDMGVTFERIDKMPMSLVRAYFAICAGVIKEQASELIQKHLMNGGKLDDISNAMTKEMEASDFFRSISENKEQKVAEAPRKGRKTEADEELNSIKTSAIG